MAVDFAGDPLAELTHYQRLGVGRCVCGLPIHCKGVAAGNGPAQCGTVLLGRHHSQWPW